MGISSWSPCRAITGSRALRWLFSPTCSTNSRPSPYCRLSAASSCRRSQGWTLSHRPRTGSTRHHRSWCPGRSTQNEPQLRSAKGSLDRHVIHPKLETVLLESLVDCDARATHLGQLVPDQIIATLTALHPAVVGGPGVALLNERSAFSWISVTRLSLPSTSRDIFQNPRVLTS